mgnify:CR=1 FL=1
MDNDTTDFLERATNLVEEHLDDPDFSAEDFCDSLFFSRSQCHRKLKAATGFSATEFIRRIRLEKAAEMIQTDDLRIAEVALKVGFNNFSYFAKCFREQYGCNPSEY